MTSVVSYIFWVENLYNEVSVVLHFNLFNLIASVVFSIEEYLITGFLITFSKVWGQIIFLVVCKQGLNFSYVIEKQMRVILIWPDKYL